MAINEATKLRRRALLPKWIRGFSWLFLLFLSIPIVGPLLGILAPDSANFDAFGLRFVGSAFAPSAMAIQAVLFLQGVAAFGLLWGKPWGLAAGMAAGAVGLSIAMYAMVLSGFSNIRLEPLLQIPFLIALYRLRGSWDEGPVQAQAAA